MVRPIYFSLLVGYMGVRGKGRLSSVNLYCRRMNRSHVGTKAIERTQHGPYSTRIQREITSVRVVG